MMINTLAKFLFEQQGFIGLAVVALAGALVYVFKAGEKERFLMREEHLKERLEWKETTSKQFETLVEATNKQTAAVEKIGTLVESMDRRRKN